MRESAARALRFGLAASLLSAAAPAVARDYYYFNKPAVSREAYAADVAECTELAGGARAPEIGPVYVSVPNTQYGMYGAAIGILFAGLLMGGEDKRMERSVQRICMADKGYVRREADKALIREIEKITDETLKLDRMFGLAAQVEPTGRKMKE